MERLDGCCQIAALLAAALSAATVWAVVVQSWIKLAWGGKVAVIACTDTDTEEPPDLGPVWGCRVG
jgi:hypothetical protein